jgi:hypothetical protein
MFTLLRSDRWEHDERAERIVEALWQAPSGPCQRRGRSGRRGSLVGSVATVAGVGGLLGWSMQGPARLLARSRAWVVGVRAGQLGGQRGRKVCVSEQRGEMKLGVVL